VKPSVIVIGAGAAGLHAARLLHEDGVQVTLLEAADRPGGRVRSLDGFAPGPIELGAEELHGERSVGLRLARARRLRVRWRRDRTCLFSDLCAGRRAPIRDDDLGAAARFFDALPGYSGPDLPLSDALAQLPARAREVLDATLGNEYGASSERLGLQALSAAEAAWEREGTRNYVLDDAPLLSLFEPGVPVLLDRQVTAIDWTGPEVLVTTRGGERFHADQALVTVPLPVLRDGDVDFTPPLPTTQRQAARSIGAGPMLKILLRFRRPLWPARRSSLTVLGAPLAPEMWTLGKRGSAPDVVLTAFVAGRPAETLLGLGAKALPALLGQLDAALGVPGERTASRSLADHVIQDWSAEPFIRCGFSYPTVGSAPLRATLAQPLCRPGAARPSVAFAGEATHDRLFGSLQGALLSAERAVEDLR
jgi:monoamine oxidase